MLIIMIWSLEKFLSIRTHRTIFVTKIMLSSNWLLPDAHSRMIASSDDYSNVNWQQSLTQIPVIGSLNIVWKWSQISFCSCVGMRAKVQILFFEGVFLWGWTFFEHLCCRRDRSANEHPDPATAGVSADWGPKSREKSLVGPSGGDVFNSCRFIVRGF